MHRVINNLVQRKLELLFLLLSLLLSVFLNAHYICGLYYDLDIPNSVYDTLQVMNGKVWYSSPGWINKPPGINFIHLLAFSIFGKSFIGIQIFSALCNILSVVLIYFIAKYILAKEIRLYYLLPLFYALFSTSEAIQGHTSNLETFMSPFEIAGILFLGLAIKNKKYIFYILSAFLLGLGFLIKQSALAVFISGLVLIFATSSPLKGDRRLFLRQAFLFLFIFFLPILIIAAYFLYLGAWHNFIERVFIRNLSYINHASQIKEVYMPWAIHEIWTKLNIEIIIFGLFALLGIFHSLFSYNKWERKLMLFWFIIPVFIISRSGFHFQHHFIEILAPFLTLSLTGLSDTYNSVAALIQNKKIISKIFVIIGIYILSLFILRAIFIVTKKNRLADSFFLTQKYLKSAEKETFIPLLLNESPDATRAFLIAQYLREHTTKEDKIFVWDHIGGDSIYLWSERNNATSFKTKSDLLPAGLGNPLADIIFTEQRIGYKDNQRKFLKEITKNRPIYIVVMRSQLPKPKAPPVSRTYSLEKKAFQDFFGILEKDYYLEAEIAALGCQAYRLR